MRIELGTAVVPVYSGHPLALAQHALTVQLHVQASAPMPVLVAALAPRMLRLAGEQADGTITCVARKHVLAVSSGKRSLGINCKNG